MCGRVVSDKIGQ